MVTHRRGPWSQAEDQFLISLVHRNGPHNWVRISQDIQTRSPKQCRERYHQNLKPSLNHNPITQEEGELIERLVNEMGKRWADIARKLEGRSDNAVKNWWNGGQNRRKRGHHDRRVQDRGNDAQRYQPTPHPYPSHGQQIEQSGQVNTYPLDNPMRALPPLVGTREHESSNFIPSQGTSQFTLPRVRAEGAIDMPAYAASSRPTTYYPQYHSHQISPPARNLPPPMLQSPHTGPVQSHNGSSRPQALDLQSGHLHMGQKSRTYDTPMPSPSGLSVVSTGEAPSLITDNGSETRSPRGAPSPMDIGLPPLIGHREERRRSSVRHLPQTGFAAEDDDNLSSVEYRDENKRRASLQLPLPPQLDGPLRPVFREPNYQPPSSGYAAQTTSSTCSPSMPRQLGLPAFETLAQPGRVPEPRVSSPLGQAAVTRSAPNSPGSENRDSRMNLSGLLS